MAQTIKDMAEDDSVNDVVNDALKKMTEDLEKNPPEDTNGGHDALMTDLVLILQDAKDFAFDDFRNTKYDAPKMALINRLQELIDSTKDGKYDN